MHLLKRKIVFVWARREFRLTTDRYGRDETCAQLLAIAAGNIFLASDAYEPQAYMATAGTALTALRTVTDARLSNLASQAFFERGGKPVWIDRGAFGGGVVPGGEPQGQVLYSGRREGLALYMARLLRPIWNEKITTSKRVKSSYHTWKSWLTGALLVPPDAKKTS